MQREREGREGGRESERERERERGEGGRESEREREREFDDFRFFIPTTHLVQSFTYAYL